MQIDERDTMFARMNFSVGSEEYKDYYSKNPEKKEKDDSIRQLPQLLGEGTMTYDEINSPIADSTFRFLSDIKKYSEGKVNSNKVTVDKVTITKKLKKLAMHYGACLVGVTKLKKEHYYSHRGRDEKTYGEKVDMKYEYALVFAVEMNKEMINRSPQLEEVIETSFGYVKAGIIGMLLSYYIRELGYEARNNMDGNYLVVAPMAAEDAGLGEMGRMGILITKEYGPRVRLGVVTTNIPLVEDNKEEFGVKDFCDICNKCSKTCPAKAIPKEPRSFIQGEYRWKIQQEKCYEKWRSLGTDCGICISTCPFSQGVDSKLIEGLKGNKEFAEETALKILKEYEEKYGIRPYIRERLDILNSHINS